MAEWGANPYTTELAGNGRPVVTITYPGTFSYRAELPDASVTALRQGMDEQVVPLQLSGGNQQVAQVNESLAMRDDNSGTRIGRTDRASHPRTAFTQVEDLTNHRSSLSV